ncbi:dockerin type I domain-containing protein [Mucisphaera calidilacus]|uniref:Dockerin domain-containing protein n=1 Tax=Mucisphaera calidilacus TaxID=2527982 RepID=A0A518BYK7_9BACT|nr:dockerin type I domain-containing protein [Mucisphaera calidilacus]QDU72059.1 hypothetical protein Pan265_19210 [Mucisphaera calidilacus]
MLDLSGGTNPGTHVFLYDPTNGLQPVIMQGDAFLDSTILNASVYDLNDNGVFTLGYSLADATEGLATWGLLEQRLPGDANLDGSVDLLDLSILANHFGQAAGSMWKDGDFTEDGAVDLLDLSILAANFNNSVIPAPASLVLLSLPLLAVTRRR